MYKKYTKLKTLKLGDNWSQSSNAEETVKVIFPINSFKQ